MSNPRIFLVCLKVWHKTFIIQSEIKNYKFVAVLQKNFVLANPYSGNKCLFLANPWDFSF